MGSSQRALEVHTTALPAYGIYYEYVCARAMLDAAARRVLPEETLDVRVLSEGRVNLLDPRARRVGPAGRLPSVAERADGAAALLEEVDSLLGAEQRRRRDAAVLERLEVAALHPVLGRLRTQPGSANEADCAIFQDGYQPIVDR